MTENSTPERLLYTREEAASRLGIGITKLKQLISTGELRSIRIGRLRRITASSLQEFIQIRELREQGADV
jgi:excisionase family DNA binding protein